MKPLTLTVLGLSLPALGCTCFAVYTPSPVYGMNFDYPPEADVGFIMEREGTASFQMMFSDESYGDWIPTVGMNEHGVFGSLQYNCPMVEGAEELSENEIYSWQYFGGVLESCADFTGAKRLLGEGRVMNMPELTLHNFVAAPDGRAMVVETGQDGNEITRIDGDWLVMTNFPIWENRELNPGEMDGVGADRYRAALSAIEERYSGFDAEAGLDVLQAAVNTDQVWGTKASMVFVPSQGLVYVAVDGDFSRIWLVDMDTGTWAPYRGIREETALSPGDGIVGVDQLREWL